MARNHAPAATRRLHAVLGDPDRQQPRRGEAQPRAAPSATGGWSAPSPTGGWLTPSPTGGWPAPSPTGGWPTPPLTPTLAPPLVPPLVPAPGRARAAGGPVRLPWAADHLGSDADLPWTRPLPLLAGSPSPAL